MEQIKRRRTLWVAFAVASMLAFCVAACAQQANLSLNYARFSKWGLSFEYPAEWHEHPADRVAMMKDYLAKELRRDGIRLEHFSMIVGPRDEACLLISKCTRPKPVKPSELIEERKKVYEEAKRAGDVTKVNHVKETVVSNLPAVEEDVERSNGGRGRTYKIIQGRAIFEISLVVDSASRFSKYSDTIEHLVSTTRVDSTKDHLAN